LRRGKEVKVGDRVAKGAAVTWVKDVAAAVEEVGGGEVSEEQERKKVDHGSEEDRNPEPSVML
jgi:hypothetical protein